MYSALLLWWKLLSYNPIKWPLCNDTVESKYTTFYGEVIGSVGLTILNPVSHQTSVILVSRRECVSISYQFRSPPQPSRDMAAGDRFPLSEIRETFFFFLAVSYVD